MHRAQATAQTSPRMARSLVSHAPRSIVSHGSLTCFACIADLFRMAPPACTGRGHRAREQLGVWLGCGGDHTRRCACYSRRECVSSRFAIIWCMFLALCIGHRCMAQKKGARCGACVFIAPAPPASPSRRALVRVTLRIWCGHASGGCFSNHANTCMRSLVLVQP